MGGVRADELLGGIEDSHSTADGDMVTWGVLSGLQGGEGGVGKQA